MLGHANLDLKNVRYPGEVPHGALVFASHGGKLFPAIRWHSQHEGQEYGGFAFLRLIDGDFPHPFSLVIDDEERCLVVQSPWRLSPIIDRTTPTTEEITDFRQCGMVFAKDGTYLMIPLVPRRGRLIDWQFINIGTGFSPFPRLTGRDLIYVSGWDLYLGNQEKPFLSWNPDKP